MAHTHCCGPGQCMTVVLVLRVCVQAPMQDDAHTLGRCWAVHECYVGVERGV